MQAVGIKFALLSCCSLSLLACSTTPPLYHWGNYENHLYQTFIEPGSQSLEEQAFDISQQIEKAELEGKRVAPGMHAHLGYLYLSQGDKENARLEFLNEKQRYPESRVFIDRLLSKNNLLK